MDGLTACFDDFGDCRLDAIVEQPPGFVGSDRQVVRFTSSTPTARSEAMSDRFRDCSGLDHPFGADPDWAVTAPPATD